MCHVTIQGQELFLDQVNAQAKSNAYQVNLETRAEIYLCSIALAFTISQPL
jgi:hypothetical protein